MPDPNPGQSDEEAVKLADEFEDLAQDFGSLVRKLNTLNNEGRARLVAEIEQSREADAAGREELARDLRAEIVQVRSEAKAHLDAALKALVPAILWKLLGGVAALLALAELVVARLS